MNQNTIQFKDVKVGQTFDFVKPDTFQNSFFNPCVKVGPRHYAYLMRGVRCLNRIGTSKCVVYNVGKYDADTEIVSLANA